MEQENNQVGRASIFQSLSDLLEWLAKVWAPLGAFIIAIAAIYWLEFIRVYAVPVSFASSSVLTGLPAMAAAIAAMVGVLTIFVLMPAALLWLPVDSVGKTLMDGHRSWRAEQRQARQGVRRLNGWDLPGRWLAAQFALGLLWTAVIAIGVVAKDVNVGVITVPATLIAILGYWCLLRPIRLAACGKPSLDFGILFCVLTGTQFLVVFGVIYVALQTAQDSAPLTLTLRALSCVIALTILSFAQLIVAKLVSNGWYPNAPKHIFLALLAVTALPTAWPPFGGAMIAFALHTSANDGKSCVVLLAADTANSKVWHDVLDAGKLDQSIPLNFAARLDDTFYVKPTRVSQTYPIPVSQTRGVASCRTDEPSPLERAPAKEPVSTTSTTAHINTWNVLSWAISAGSMLVAICSLRFSVRSWRETNRPLVVARIVTRLAGNAGIALDLIVENTGNRPALDMQLSAAESDVRQALVDPSPNAKIPTDAARVFFSSVFVPVLAAGQSVSNAFGWLGMDGVWRPGASIPIAITYRGVGGRHFREPMVLLLASDQGFAQTSWSTSGE